MLTLCGSAVSRHVPARPGPSLAGPFPADIQGGSESNIGTWASTLVVPYPFDPEFWSGCSSSVGGTGTFQSKNCDKSKLTSISKGGSGFFLGVLSAF